MNFHSVGSGTQKSQQKGKKWKSEYGAGREGEASEKQYEKGWYAAQKKWNFTTFPIGINKRKCHMTRIFNITLRRRMQKAS